MQRNDDNVEKCVWLSQCIHPQNPLKFDIFNFIIEFGLVEIQQIYKFLGLHSLVKPGIYLTGYKPIGFTFFITIFTLA